MIQISTNSGACPHPCYRTPFGVAAQAGNRARLRVWELALPIPRHTPPIGLDHAGCWLPAGPAGCRQLFDDVRASQKVPSSRQLGTGVRVRRRPPGRYRRRTTLRPSRGPLTIHERWDGMWDGLTIPCTMRTALHVCNAHNGQRTRQTQSARVRSRRRQHSRS